MPRFYSQQFLPEYTKDWYSSSLPVGNNTVTKSFRKAERLEPGSFTDKAKRRFNDLLTRFTGLGSGEVTPEQQSADAMMGAVSPLGINVYHGTGAKQFSKFNLDKIGSGEGAQAYGHGLYFAGDPEVARSYYDSLKTVKGGLTWRGQDVKDYLNSTTTKMRDYIDTKTDDNFRKAFDSLSEDINSRIENSTDNKILYQLGMGDETFNDPGHIRRSVEAIRSNLAQDIKGSRNTIRLFQKDLDRYRTEPKLAEFLGGPLRDAYEPAGIKQQLDSITDSKSMGRYVRGIAKDLRLKEPTVQGGIIKAEIPDEAVSRMIKWDEPLHAQPEAFKNILSRFHPKAERDVLVGNPGYSGYQPITPLQARTMSNYTDNNGSGLYRSLDEVWGGPSNASTREYYDAGIPGIKYLNGSSRGRNYAEFRPENFNYVSFSDELPKILDYFDWKSLKAAPHDW